MKKKLSAVMIVAIVIAFIASVAVASAILTEYFQGVIASQNENGYFQQWPLEDKQKLIDAMVEENFEIDMDLVQKMKSELLSDEERAEIADEIVIGYYGSGHDGVLSAVDVMEKHMGKMADWELEEKAWLSKEAGDESPKEVHILPQNDDISKDQAIQLAGQALQRSYGLTADALANYHVTVDFMLLTDDSDAELKKERVYQVAFYPLPTDEHPYSVLLKNDGTVVHTSEPFGQNKNVNDIIGEALKKFATPEEKAEFCQTWTPVIRNAVAAGEEVRDYYCYLSEIEYVFPNESYLSQQIAEEKANEGIKASLGWGQELLNCYDVHISLRKTEIIGKTGEQAVWYLKYIVNSKNVERFWDNEIPWGANVAIDAATGNVVLAEQSTNDSKFSRFKE